MYTFYGMYVGETFDELTYKQSYHVEKVYPCCYRIVNNHFELGYYPKNFFQISKVLFNLPFT